MTLSGGGAAIATATAVVRIGLEINATVGADCAVLRTVTGFVRRACLWP